MARFARRMQQAVTAGVVDDFVLGVTVPDPAANVGVFSGVIRTTYSGPTTITTDGTVVRDKNITSYITVNAANVSFINCYFSAGGDLNNGGMVDCKTASCSNISFYRCTFIPSTMSDRRDGADEEITGTRDTVRHKDEPSDDHHQRQQHRIRSMPVMDQFTSVFVVMKEWAPHVCFVSLISL